MKKKRKDILSEYEELKKELIFDQVRMIISGDHNTWSEKLEIIGFEWQEEEDKDFLEEIKAVPENSNQEILISYFEEKVDLDNKIIEVWFIERNSGNSNFP